MARRQRERQRQQRRREKAAKRQERRDAKAEAGTVDLDDTIDWESAIREEIIETDEDSEAEAEAG